jgi:hypothetical protein
MGGMALNTGPVQALTITPDTLTDNTLKECQYWQYQFTYNCDSIPDCCTFTPYRSYDWWVIGGTLPPGLTLDQNGLLSGCPDAASAGTYNFTILCTELACCFPSGTCGPNWASSIVTLTVGANPQVPLTINPTFYPVAWEGLPFSMPLSATGCSGTYNWTAMGLPVGLSVTDPVNGIISGIPAPGTCGIYTVTATVTDTSCPGTACCPPVNRDFILIVDCWANYPPIFYPDYSACDFTVEIGSGLTQGQTKVLVDGANKATLVGGQSKVFTSQPCESHLVMVDQTVQVPNSNTRFSVIGSNIKTVTDTDNYAYFNYAPEVYIQTASDPSGIAQPPGIGYYAVGSNFSSTTPGTVETDIQNGKKYVFREWTLPDGTTRPTRDLLFPVNQAGTVTAAYDTYYLLTLKSDYPAINELSWERSGSTATWNLSLHAVPLLGFWGFLGGVQSPLNASGSQLITGPTTVEIQWGPNYTMPIVAIIIALLVIVGLIVLIYRLRSRPAAKTEVKEASSKAKKTAAENFCPKCGNPVDKDADYCKKCGKKLK